MTTKLRIVTGVIGNDIHVVANRILVRGLTQHDFKVCNLGVSVSNQLFIDAAVEYSADAILISSINGEAFEWIGNFRSECNAAGMQDLIIYIGGNLSIGDKPASYIEQRFIDAGFDRAYHRPSSLDTLIEDLNTDFAIRFK